MATVVFEGFVQERRGRMVRVSEEYRKKDASGKWETAGYGNFTVWLKDEDSQPEIQEGAVVLVQGDLRVSTSEKEGRTFTNLNISFAKVGIVRTTSKYRGAAVGGAVASNSAPAGDWSSAPVSGAQAGAWGDSPF